MLLRPRCQPAKSFPKWPKVERKSARALNPLCNYAAGRSLRSRRCSSPVLWHERCVCTAKGRGLSVPREAGLAVVSLPRADGAAGRGLAAPSPKRTYGKARARGGQELLLLLKGRLCVEEPQENLQSATQLSSQSRPCSLSSLEAIHSYSSSSQRLSTNLYKAVGAISFSSFKVQGRHSLNM